MEAKVLQRYASILKTSGKLSWEFVDKVQRPEILARKLRCENHIGKYDWEEIDSKQLRFEKGRILWDCVAVSGGDLKGRFWSLVNGLREVGGAANEHLAQLFINTLNLPRELQQENLDTTMAQQQHQLQQHQRGGFDRDANRDHFDKVAEHESGAAGKQWKQLGRKLGVQEKKIMQIDKTGESLSECVMQVLLEWQEKEEVAKLSVLTNALRDVGLVQIAAELEDSLPADLR